MTNMYFQVCSFFYMVMTLILFFTKKRVKSLETNVFSIMSIVNIIGIILDIIIVYLSYVTPGHTSLYVLNKIYLLYIVLWTAFFTYYITNITLKKHHKIMNTIILSILIIAVGLISILNINLYNLDNVMYTYGPSVTASYVIEVAYIIIILLVVLFHMKSIFNRKYVPLLVFAIISVFALVVRIIDPGLLLTTTIITFINIVMYHTIENPDVKVIEKLDIAKTTAEKANRAKSDFLSSMSHEIRTPLNAIVGFSECIKSASDLDEAKENANDVITASQTLLEIVNGILDISKIESGKLELVETDYDTKKLFRDIKKLIIARIGDKQLDFKVDIAEDIPNVLYGDHFNIKKILINLLTNAVKYTDSGYVYLSVKCVKNNDLCRLVISVKDSGRGIKQENIDKLFTKFNRLDEDRNTTIEGTGLGLAITKQLVDMMNGKIVVNSVHGEGSEFTVAITQKISNKVIEAEEEDEFEFLDLTGKKILLVDDNKLNLKVAQKLLSPYNPTIDICEDGQECLDKIKLNSNYDLILLDDMMPKLRGPEVLNKLKENPNFNIPVIALTANAINGIKEQYLNMGFNDYLAKPIDKNDLNDILSKYLNKKIEIVKKEEKMVNTSDKKILIVDDNKLNIKIAIHAMKSYNFNIDEAYSGMECIEKVKTNQYDLIFMDYMMPEMDGIETLNNLKQIPNFKTPVIALTADAIDGAREKFLSAGFDEYVAKPINQGFLNDAIVSVIENKMNVSINTKGNVTYLKDNGINVDVGVSVLGNIELYNQTLSFFLESIEERLIKLNNWKVQSNLKNYAYEVNALKSDCNYLGFTNLLNIATIHETEANNNNIEYINNNYQVLINEVVRLVNVIRKYL